jgi:hypothetical protein
MNKLIFVMAVVSMFSAAAFATPVAVTPDQLAATQKIAIAAIDAAHGLTCSLQGSKFMGGIPVQRLIQFSTSAWTEQSSGLPTFEFATSDSRGQSVQMVTLHHDGKTLISVITVNSLLQPIDPAKPQAGTQLVPFQISVCK